MLTRAAIIVVCCLVLLPGCAFNQPTGPPTRRRRCRPEKALVYFYRPRGESFGYDRTYFLAINGQPVVDLLHGGYLPYEVAPGRLALVSDVNRSLRTNVAGGFLELAAGPQAATLELAVEPGKTYYVRLRPEAHAISFTPHLQVVARDAAEQELTACKLLARRP